jgi:hypothetical protein
MAFRNGNASVRDMLVAPAEETSEVCLVEKIVLPQRSETPKYKQGVTFILSQLIDCVTVSNVLRLKETSFSSHSAIDILLFSVRMLCYPRRDMIVEALSLLHAMGGIDDTGKITPVGHTLSVNTLILSEHVE